MSLLLGGMCSTARKSSVRNVIEGMFVMIAGRPTGKQKEEPVMGGNGNELIVTGALFGELAGVYRSWDVTLDRTVDGEDIVNSFTFQPPFMRSRYRATVTRIDGEMNENE